MSLKKRLLFIDAQVRHRRGKARSRYCPRHANCRTMNKITKYALLDILLIVLPLVSLIFSTIYVYNSAEFIELLVSQPLRRTRLLHSLFSGLAVSLLLAFLAGTGLPILIYAPSAAGLLLLFTGLALTVLFVALAVLASVVTPTRRGASGWRSCFGFILPCFMTAWSSSSCSSLVGIHWRRPPSSPAR